MHWAAELIHIHIGEAAFSPMHALAEVRLLAGIGVASDRYAAGTGTYSARHHVDRQVTLIETETLAALARDHGIHLVPPRSPAQYHDTRRGAQPPRRALFQYRELRALRRAPQRAMPLPRGPDRQEDFKSLINRSVLNCRVVVGGTIGHGTHIEPCEAASLDAALRAINEAVAPKPPPELW